MIESAVATIPEITEPRVRVEIDGIEQYSILFKSFFGFSTTPFSNTPDYHSFYMSQQHRDALMNLLFGVEQRKGFIVIAGEVGAGKSTLCRHFLQQLPSHIKTAVVLNPNLAGVHLMATIVRDFGIECKGKTKKDYFDALNQFLLAGLETNQNACLIIDEAQCLSVRVLEDIRLLSNLETSKQKLIQIVLMGQPELKDLLMRHQLRQLRQRIGVYYHLQALNLQDTKEYIYHRLKHASEGELQVSMSDSVIMKIFELSKGTPRLINAISDRILMAAFAQQTKNINLEIARPAFEEVSFICA